MKFRPRKIFYYFGLIILVLVISLIFTNIFWPAYDNEGNKISLSFYNAFMFLISLSIIIYHKFTVYYVKNRKLVIEKPLSKPEEINLEEIFKIEEDSWPLFSIKLYLLSQKKPLVLSIDNVDKFVTAYLEAINDVKDISFSKDSKTILIN